MHFINRDVIFLIVVVSFTLIFHNYLCSSVCFPLPLESLEIPLYTVLQCSLHLPLFDCPSTLSGSTFWICSVSQRVDVFTSLCLLQK